MKLLLNSYGRINFLRKFIGLSKIRTKKSLILLIILMASQIIACKSADLKTAASLSLTAIDTIEQSVLDAYRIDLITPKEVEAFAKLNSKAIKAHNLLVAALRDDLPSEEPAKRYYTILLQLVDLVESFGVEIPPEITNSIKILKSHLK